MATIAPEVEAELGSAVKADDRAALEKENALLRAEINDLQSKITTTTPFKGTTTSGLEVDMDAVVEVETDVFLYIFTELMRPGTATVLSVPECTKMFGQITRSDCITFAKGFGYLSKSTPDNGDVVGEFFNVYPGMAELVDRNSGYEELLVLASMKIASGNRKYAAVRLMLGALLSTFDTMTDIYMVYTYYSTNEHAFARATMFSLFANIAIQLGIVVLQNKNLGLGRLVKEMMYVIFFIKPGVDASRVVLGTEQSAGSVTNPKIEMILSKLSELFTEAIPGSLIQSYAFLTGANQTTAAIFSIIVSIFCAAFTSAGVSFDMDLDRASRAQTPQFFGYIPNGMKVKGKVFLSMFVMSACQLAAKAFACALGAVQSFLVVFAYMAIDFAIFFGYKLCRRDFWYWIPVDGVTGIFVSILFRIIGKTVTDFTALLQFRHPFDLGGAYYCWTLLSTPFVCFYFGWAYLQYVESEEGEARNLPMKLFPWQVYTGIGSLMLVHFINVMYFLTTINSKYIRTFYSTLSGNQQEIGNFVNPERADERKIDVFSRNRHKWERIEEEVLDWVNLKIPEWNESQPIWWNARRKASIPDWAVREEGVLKSIRSVEVIEVVKRMRTSR